MIPVSSWGRLNADLHRVVTLNDPIQIKNFISNEPFSGIAHGMGRSYGDVCLNPGGTLWLTAGLDHFIAFDDSTGRLVCEAGVLLRDIQRFMIPRGWMLPVTPGTQMVTVGGAIANDVHGKNHHRQGSFGHHVQRITLVRTNGEVICCGPDMYQDWFAATVGGLGLTGIIIQAELQLYRVNGPWFDTETIPYANLNEFFILSDNSKEHWEYSVSWIDCASLSKGRGLFMRANSNCAARSLEPTERALTIPAILPISLVNRMSLPLCNIVYYHLKKWQARRKIMHYVPFFYPLDRVLNWNRVYGAKGFFQYQCVMPREVSQDVIQVILKEIARSRYGPLLAVLKTFGNRQSVGMLSFPQPGVTLALDFPNYKDRTYKLFERLDHIICDAGGRLYMAKDACMPRFLFEAGYPHLTEFLKYRDPGISSGLSRRLIGS